MTGKKGNDNKGGTLVVLVANVSVWLERGAASQQVQKPVRKWSVPLAVAAIVSEPRNACTSIKPLSAASSSHLCDMQSQPRFVWMKIDSHSYRIARLRVTDELSNPRVISHLPS